MPAQNSKLAFVEILWDDAWMDNDNFATVHGIELTHKPMVVKTRGWLLVDDAAGVSVANEESKTEDGTVFRGRTFIPRQMIKSVTPYKLVKPRKRAKPAGLEETSHQTPIRPSPTANTSQTSPQ